MLDKGIVCLRGGGDLATGIACRLFNAGFKVLISEISEPTVIRREVSFAQAVYEKEVFVEGICCRLAYSMSEALILMEGHVIPVIVDGDMKNFKNNKPYILVDAILAKRNLGTSLDMASIVIGVGPGFTAGLDVDAVVETKRGHDLGKVILHGTAIPDTGIPGNIGGYSIERVLKSPKAGTLRIVRDIGSIVEEGDTVAVVDGTEVRTRISGVVRGMIQEGYEVHENMKIADVDPRAVVCSCFSISDKARSVGGGVLEAILYLENKSKRENFAELALA
jgi:xanthine dehydrogenase accessory factor